MGETISYSSGKVPKEDTTELVKICREIAPRLKGGVLIRMLCNALEEKEREVERLREEARNLESMIVAIGGAGTLQAAREREEKQNAN